MPFSDVVNGVVLENFPGANSQIPNFTHFPHDETHLRNFGLLESPNLSHFTRFSSSETLKLLLKPSCASFCVFASYALILKHLSEESLRFLQRERENAVL